MSEFTEKGIFTSGDVARICQVSGRTVQKWFDSGRLRGYRIPGSQDRRIPREHLIRFLKEHGMPLGELEDTPDETSLDEVARTSGVLKVLQLASRAVVSDSEFRRSLTAPERAEVLKWIEEQKATFD